VLLALQDGEMWGTLDADRVHMQACTACQARVSAIVNHAAIVRRSLSSITIPPLDADALRRRLAATRATSVVPLWRRPVSVAAAALIVAAAAAAASPLRHWIIAHTRAPEPTVVPPSASAPVESPKVLSGSTVSFAAPGPEFTVRLDSLPTAGVLAIERTAANEISAQVTSGASTGGDAMVVLPGELRLRNATSSRASYTLTLPRGVTRLRVVVAGRVLLDGPPVSQVKLTGLPK
jgi:hypothetical protein